MLLTVAQLASYTLNKHGPVFLANGIFTLFGSLVGIHLQQVFTMNERYLFGQKRLDFRISFASEILRAQNGGIDAVYDIFQKSHIALPGRDDSLPVPLVYI